MSRLVVELIKIDGDNMQRRDDVGSTGLESKDWPRLDSSPRSLHVPDVSDFSFRLLHVTNAS